jgi:hypothetical protein
MVQALCGWEIALSTCSPVPSQVLFWHLCHLGQRSMPGTEKLLSRATPLATGSLLLAVASIIFFPANVARAQGYCDQIFSNQHVPPATELVVARLHFGTNGNIGHCGWSHNYPSSDQNLNEFIRSSTRVDVELQSFRVIDLESPEVFDYPFLYISEPGEMQLSEIEIRNLREFIRRGGFILMDDFDGEWQLETMLSEVRRAFPEQYLGPLSTEYGAFSTVLPLENLDGLSPYVPGGEITYYGLFNDAGELAIAAGHNNDLANFWDWYDDGQMPLKPAADAFRLGINFIVWAMTH